MIATIVCGVSGRPMVRQIRSAQEFDRLVEKHASTTGLPVIADFYSDGCGPCRQIAPVFKQLAEETGQENAVFVKINTQSVPELSGRYNIRSIPTFIFFHEGKKVDLLNGASAQALQQSISSVVSRSRMENVILKKESLVAYYKEVDENTAEDKIDTIYQKCADMTKKYNPNKECLGNAAFQLTRKLKRKYNKRVDTVSRFTADDRSPKPGAKDQNKEDARGSGSGSGSASSKKKSTSGASDKPNLHMATKEQLLEELEKRLEAEEDAQEDEEDDEFEEFKHSYVPSDFPERVTIIGGGPAGMSAAIYAARAGLKPVVVAPPGGGQLVGKGVEVENYPGLANVTGPEVVAAMRSQAAQFGAVFECELVTSINTNERPFKVYTNSSAITTHAIIVATGAESNWLNVPGEYEMRGGGVSSCAVCDGAAYYEKDVVVIGGGDSAMEEALFLARTSKSVTLIHRRDEFRASKIMAQRVIEHPSIKIKWNTIVKKIVGEKIAADTDGDDLDLDNVQTFVNGVITQDVVTGEESKIPCAGVFVAIGHTPSTQFLKGIVEFDENYSGYLMTQGESTRLSVPGIFAAGDVSDAIYRQAVTSAGSGAAAALDAERWLSEEGLGNEEAEFEAALMAELMADDIDSSKTESYNAYEDVGGKISGMKESTTAEL